MLVFDFVCKECVHNCRVKMETVGFGLAVCTSQQRWLDGRSILMLTNPSHGAGWLICVLHPSTRISDILRVELRV